MGRGRGKARKQEALLVENKSENQSLGIGTKLVLPGQVIELSAEEVENPGVEQFLRKGILGKIRTAGMMKRLVVGKPRILVAVHTLFRGGAEVATMELHRQLKKFGCEQALLNIYAGNTEFHTMLADDAREIFDIYQNFNVSSKDEIREIIRDFASKYRPDIVMYSLLREAPECLVTLPDRPPVVQVMQSELGDSQWGYDPVGTDAVVTVSRKMAENMEKGLDIPQEKLFPIWNGINPRKIFAGKSLRKKMKIPQYVNVVGMIGNLNDLKRPLMGLEAFAKARNPSDHMIFAGNPHDMGNAVKQRVEELNLSKYVHILGLRDDIEDIYATLDVMLNCSTSEGLPMSIVEAMFARLPVIASAVGGNPEVVLHGMTGYLFNPDDSQALTDFLERLIENRKLRRNLGYEGYMRACEEFHMEVLGKQYLDVLAKFTVSPEEIECSVVMPVWNGAKWLDRAIWSVRRQTFPYFEFIIVDDGSTDNSRHIIQKHMDADKRIRLITLEHGGIVKALNAGIKASNFPLIARIDADDEMVPNRLELQIDFMDNNRGIDVCGTQMLGRSADGVDRGPMNLMPLTHDAIKGEMPHKNPISHPTVMFRKDAWKNIGGYKGDGRCEDYRMWAEMIMKGCRFANMEEALVIYTHTHEGDVQYAEWRDSVFPEIWEILNEGAVANV